MKKILIKIGGRAASAGETLGELVREMADLGKNYDFILVHGGGAEVSRVTKIFGIEPVFKDGIRMTSEAEMEIVDMVLAGKMNKALVRLFQRNGTKAVGLSGSDGGLFTGHSLEGGRSVSSGGEGSGSRRGNRTGRIDRVDPELLDLLGKAGYLPVLASTSMDEEGGGLNINADEAALAVAEAVKADALVFLSDIPGIMKDGEVRKTIDEKRALGEIEAGVITGGMIPKVKSSLEALHAGVKAVVIGEFLAYGNLSLLLERRQGTTITAS